MILLLAENWQVFVVKYHKDHISSAIQNCVLNSDQDALHFVSLLSQTLLLVFALMRLQCVILEQSRKTGSVRVLSCTLKEVNNLSPNAHKKRQHGT